MWTRAELKSQAKIMLKGRYGESIAACLIVWAITLAASLAIGFIPIVGSFGSLAVTFFLALPLTVGLNFYFMQNRLAPPQIRHVFIPFSGDRYMKIVGSMAWYELFIFLWSLIPLSGVMILMAKYMANYMVGGYMSGRPDIYSPYFFAGHVDTFAIACIVIYLAGVVVVMIKQISYSMAPYILTDNPNMRYDRVLKLSISMTYGQKWSIFVLGLSFIGWSLLCLLTLGIGFIFLAPYINATNAELYVRLRNIAIQNGLTSPQELNLVYVGEQQNPAGSQSTKDQAPFTSYGHSDDSAPTYQNDKPQQDINPQPKTTDVTPNTYENQVGAESPKDDSNNDPSQPPSAQ